MGNVASSPVFEAIASDSSDAVRLLNDYFESRELGFATLVRDYRRVQPDPSWFTPPAGVFVVVRDDNPNATARFCKRVG